MLATGFPNDWLDQTMSYQLIQTTSFSMHPRLIEYNAVALDWMGRLSWTGRRYLAGTVRGRPSWYRSLLPEVQGRPSWFTSLELEQHEDQAQRMKSRVEAQNVEVQYGSSADQVQSTSAVFKVRCIDKPAGCPVVGREMLATGFPNDWLDQTMSYQLIQTTSFAMHPRLIEYNAVALDWIAKAKRCRINLSKRHRFAIANSKYHLLVNCSCLLIPSLLSAPAELSSSADCDDITADVIIADSRSCASLHNC
ncbi:hypothetical protein F511_16908 [Dorcoceras hygrometricum]|uniref:Uncharacterized protein n=1 Tax=Dorcoceras hygrometricum TaxID=472368 RepID=A0A2Z7BAX1_9LAMI|nr:hypothetical protein F511_16908 [Dorcoceras hygrometricum]